MKWQKTTFGELKAGDVFETSLPDDHGGYDVVFLRLATQAKVEKDWDGGDREVYRLVLRSAEREALEKIVMAYDHPNHEGWFNTATRMCAIAKEALEGK